MQKIANKLVGVNSRGCVVGEDHHKAVLTDGEVALLLELREEGFSYRWLSVKFDVSKSCVQKICNGRHRGKVPDAYRRIRGRGERG